MADYVSYGDDYEKDGFLYYYKFNDNFRYKCEDKQAITESIKITQAQLNHHFEQANCDTFIFTNCTFTDQLHIQGNFYKTIIFKKCYFTDIIHFSEATFYNQVIFENCRFRRSIDCTGATFKNKVIFSKSIFTNIVNFYKAKFMDEVSFQGADFRKKTVFTNAIFNKKADFGGMIVMQQSNNGFYFDSNNKIPDTADVIFDDTRFSAPIFFNGRCFKEKISFNNTLFNNIFNFTDVDFGSKAQLNTIKINYHQIQDAELWINILKNNLNENYSPFAQKLIEINRDIVARASNLTDSIIIEGDDNILISRQDTSLMLGVPINTLKTWTARGQSELVFKKENDQCGYTLASIKEYKRANPNINKVKNKEEEPVCDYASAIRRVITYSAPYITTTRMMRGEQCYYLPIIENNTIVGIFSNAIESEFTYRKKMHSHLNLQELTIKEMLDVVGNSIEGFLFTKPKTKVKEVKQMFIQDSHYQEGIGVVFLTSNGKANGELVGMVRLRDLIRI